MQALVEIVRTGSDFLLVKATILLSDMLCLVCTVVQYQLFLLIVSTYTSYTIELINELCCFVRCDCCFLQTSPTVFKLYPVFLHLLRLLMHLQLNASKKHFDAYIVEISILFEIIINYYIICCLKSLINSCEC